MQCDPALASVFVQRLDNAGAEFVLHVAPAADLAVGPFWGVVLVRPRREKGEEPPFSKLRLSGAVLADLRAVPDAILLGPIAVGQSVVRRATIRSRSGDPVSIEKAESPTESVEVRVVAASDQPRSQIVLTLSVGEAGPHRAAVNVYVRREGVSSPNAVSIPIQWYGVSKGAIDEA